MLGVRDKIKICGEGLAKKIRICWEGSAKLFTGGGGGIGGM